MALAPRRPLFGVPSSFLSASSMRRWSRASMPESASKISPLTASTALQHALAEVALLVAVAQLDGLVRSRRGAGGHAGAAQRAVLEDDIHLDGRVAAAVQDLAADDIDDGGHGSVLVSTGVLSLHMAGRVLALYHRPPKAGKHARDGRMSDSGELTPDKIVSRRSERRVFILATSFGFLMFLVVGACLPNVGPVFRVFSNPSGSMLPALPSGAISSFRARPTVTADTRSTASRCRSRGVGRR